MGKTQEIQVHGFTITSNRGIENVLISDVFISQAFQPGQPNTDLFQHHKFHAIWDTGATNTVITQNVIKTCNLKPISLTVVNTAAGPTQAEQFLVNAALPNKVGIAGLLVSSGKLHGNIDVLIGMDIIAKGDLVISNHGKTVFSFRMPSLYTIDLRTLNNANLNQLNQNKTSETKPKRIRNRKKKK